MKRGILDTYHTRDARQLLSVLPTAQFVDTTITSPPYWNLKDYGSQNQVGFGQKCIGPL
jgi:DNA modification methylase